MNRVSILIILLVATFSLLNSGCDCCDNPNDCGDTAPCPNVDDDTDDDILSDDDDDDTMDDDASDDDDDDDQAPTILKSAEYIAGGNFSGAAIAMDNIGNPHLVAGKSRHLRHYTNDGSGWEYELAGFGMYSNPSFTIDDTGDYHLAFYDWYENCLWYAKGDAGGWTMSLIDDDGDVGHYSSIITDPNGDVHIAYSVESSRDPIGLRYATKSSGVWITEDITMDPGSGGFPSIAVSPLSIPYVTFNDEDPRAIKIARRTGAGWDIADLEYGAPYNRSSGITIDGAGTIHVAYRANDGTSHLRYASGDFGTLAGQVIDDLTPLGDSVSIALDQSGFAHLAYFNSGGSEIMYANNVAKAWAVQNLGQGYPVNITATNTNNVAISIGDFGIATNAGGSWTTTMIDNGFRIVDSALALDSFGQLHVAYIDARYQALKYTTNTIGPWKSVTVELPIGESGYADIAVGDDGICHISFYDDNTHELRYATGAMALWNLETVDSDGIVGAHNNIVLDSEGYAHISYYDQTLGRLKYATNRTGLWQSFIVDDTGIVGEYSTMALGTGGGLHIAYADISGSDVNYAIGSSSIWNIYTADENQGGHTDIAVDHQGGPYISYYRAGLRYAQKSGGVLKTWSIDAGALEGGTAIRIDSDMNLGIAYQTYGWDLAYAYGAKGAWDSILIDATAKAGFDPSMAVAPSGKRYISYIAENALWLAILE